MRLALPLIHPERAEPRAVRLSITDRCDLACVYCRPHRRDGYLPAERRIGVEHWATVVRGLVLRGVTRVRITGGEPLIHPQIVEIARAIAAIEGIEDLAITTNGTRLAELAGELRSAGVRRLNLSIDSLDPGRFSRITRGGRLEDVLAGFAAARDAGFELKTNTVVIGGEDGNLDELASLVELAWTHGATPRFLELMSVGEGARIGAQFVGYSVIRAKLAPLLLDDPKDTRREDNRGPAIYARALGGRIGFITGASDTFCSGCDRLRVSTDGKLRPCLATNDAVDVGDAIRAGDLTAIADGLTEAWAQKPADGWRGCTEASAASVDMRATGG